VPAALRAALRTRCALRARRIAPPALSLSCTARSRSLALPRPPHRAGAKPACGTGLTHAAPGEAALWRFVWAPDGAGGPITFHAAVAVGFSHSFLQHACLRDAADGAGEPSDHAGHEMRRRRRLASAGGAAARAAQQTQARRLAGLRTADAALAAPPGTVFAACPAAAASSHASGGMAAGGVWSTAAGEGAAGATPVLFSGAAMSSRGRFAGALLATFAFAAASSTAGAWAASREAEAFAHPCDEAPQQQPPHAPDAPPLLRATPQPARYARAQGATAVVLRTGGHYACMLISMTYNVWLILALMGGHAAAYLLFALTQRRTGRAPCGGDVAAAAAAAT
jgi:hypothetical protein